MTDKIHFEYTPLSELIAYPRNPKSHDIGALDTSIKKFGYVSPVIVDTTTGYIVAGHGRVQTLMQMKNVGDKPPNRIEVDGNEWLVPVIYVVMTDEHEVMSYIVADNRLTQIGGWDEPMLADVLVELAGAGDGLLDVTGYDGDDLDELLKTLEPPAPIPDTEPQIDKAKELQAEWQTERGQVWLVGGKHRVMCGDSTSGDDVARLMDGKRAESLFTSPPYADMRDYMGDVELDPQVLKSFIRVYKPFCAYQVVNLGIKRKNHEVVPYWDEYITEAHEAGLKLLSWNIWDRGASTSIANETAFFAIEHEWLFVFGEKPKDLNRTIGVSESTQQRRKYHKRDEQNRQLTQKREKDGTISFTTRGEQGNYKKLGTIIYAPSAQDRTELLSIHPARFSVALVIPHLEAMTNENDICIDPFLGSGTTLIACAQTGRVCYGMEISPEYVAVILQRAKDAGLECELLS